LRADLTQASQDFWNNHAAAIDGGIIHAGRFENYFRTFRTWVLPLIHSQARREQLLEAKDALDRQRFWEQQWNTIRWRLLFRIFFSRFLMARLGRDPEFFRYVEGSVADQIMKRTEYAFTELSTHDNPYLEYIVRGTFRPALPPYLRPENFELIRAGLGRMTLAQGPIEEVGKRYQDSGFDGFNLSDIFEYLDPDTSRQLYGKLLALARPKARLAYWNTFVPRSCPPEFLDRVQPLRSLADRLLAQDRAFFYSKFEVDEVVR
jgi:S-adenosylmethionine-diacylglycerol 3-amino-3-carboxypropyl transferase